jgi:hypothetical protein
MSDDALIETAAEAIRHHGYEFVTGTGGTCPACDHVYFEKPAGAYMDPDLDWLTGAIAEHRAHAVVEAVRDQIAAEALREAADEARPYDSADWLRDRADRLGGAR